MLLIQFFYVLMRQGYLCFSPFPLASHQKVVKARPTSWFKMIRRYERWGTQSDASYVYLGPDLWRILSTPHSTLNVFEWGNPECGVWILCVECWVSIIHFGPKLATITQHSTLKTPDPAPCIWMENLKCGRIHIPWSGFPHSNTWTVECGVLRIRHKFGTRISSNIWVSLPDQSHKIFHH